jgi:hypothetical protein
MSNTIGTVYDDGDYSKVQPVSLPELSAPIATDNTRYILTQDFQQAEASYSPAPLNTPYPLDNGTGGVSGETWAGSTAYNGQGFILVGEGPLRDQGAGVVQWTRRYARLPNSHSEPTQVSYQFPGFLEFVPLEVLIRNPFTRSVPGVIKYDYFNSGTNTSAAIQAVETANYIPAQIYYWPRTFSPPLPSSSLTVDYLWDATSPSLATYTSWISNGTTTITPQASQFRQWEGTIIRRELITILPQ